MKKIFGIIFKQKRLLFSIFYALIFTAFFVVSSKALAIQNEFDKSLYQNVIRLHIIADDDSDYAQAAKLKIRDGILPFLARLTENAHNANEAERILKSNISLVESELKNVISQLGYDYQTTIELTKEYYPVRKYGLFTFPSGTYTSFKINLGSARGKNFWCIIYPSVCTELCNKQVTVKEKLSYAGLSANAADAICDDDRILFDFYFLELIQKLCKNLKQ